ncbi:MAG: histidine kinase [Acidimicrobiales bacterium]|nr:histidine kinase [Acidimicrobiales bacterium]
MTALDTVLARAPEGSPTGPARTPVPGLVLLAAPLAIAIAVGGVVAADRSGIVAADWVRLALVATWAAAALATVRRAELRRLGRLLGAGTLLGALGFAAARYADGRTGSGADAARFAAPLACLVLIAVTFHVLLALPDGHLATSVRRGGAAVGYAIAALIGIVLGSRSEQVTVAGGVVAWSLAVIAALPAAHRTYLKSAGTMRQRLQWLGCGAAMAAEIGITLGAMRVFVGWPAHAGAVAAAGTALIPLAIVASMSPRLAGRIDQVLVHTVSVVGLTVVVITVYVVVVLGLGRSPTGKERELLGLSMIAAGIAAIAYVPARERLTDAANRLVYGERRAPDEALRTFGQRLTRAIPMEELLLQLVESLRKTMALTAAEVWTGGGDVLELEASVPDHGAATLAVGAKERTVVARAGVSGTAWATVWLPALVAGRDGAQLRIAPVSHSGELLGLIVVERPAEGDVFTEEDERVLTELARQVGLALHNVQLDSALQASLDEVRRQAEELRASRARIVATADAERRKIERNLHDGAQQHLVALAVNLRLAKDLLVDDPATASEMLDALAADVKDTIQDLRDLAHGIYPPLLRDSGVIEALRAASSRSPLAVDVDAEGLGRFPTEIEAAVYFCCLEALQNAAKHAPDSRVMVKLWEESGGLLFTVTDDGPGFDAEVAQRGHGFTNMSDRLGAIGGTVRWESSPGHGSTVRGSVPLPRV